LTNGYEVLYNNTRSYGVIQLRGTSKMQKQTIKKAEKTLHTCVNCGHTGDNLIGNYYWIGGKGDVLVYECQDCLNARREASQKACEALRIAIKGI